MTVLVFDLDDTLYPELSFVHGGLAAVACYIEREYGHPAAQGFAFLTAELARAGRGRLFDALLERLGCRTTAAVRRCLALYRTHAPALDLHPDADACLRRLARLPQYLVTDGNKEVQARKAAALGLDRRLRGLYITHRHGVRHAKPSPYCFLRICAREGIEPHRLVYVGDNPHKDFRGIRPLGMRTVRLLRGPYAEVVVPPEQDAEIAIESFDQLDAVLAGMGLLPTARRAA